MHECEDRSLKTIQSEKEAKWLNKNGKDLGTLGSLLDVLAYTLVCFRKERRKKEWEEKRKNEEKLRFEEIMITWKQKSIILTNGNLKYPDLDRRRWNAPITGSLGAGYLTVAASAQELLFAYQPA